MPILSRIKHKIRRGQQPKPIPTASNYILVILDSCRYDALAKAQPKTILKLGSLQKRWSYASWTAPSHYNLLMGLLPHSAPKNVFASTFYKKDLEHFGVRLNMPNIQFQHMLPRMWLPKYLKSLGYYTRALVSMPVLNPNTPLAVDFDSYELVEKHNDLMAMIPKLQFSAHRPTFYLLNTGETHYPYAPPDEPESQWPRIHGLHGVFKRMQEGSPISSQFFNLDRLKQLQQRQVRVLDWVDRAIEALFDSLPANTYVTITSDHGELFGEEGFFGHGPIHHPKIWEVPLVEGKLR
ncbi:MAG: sulfatase-like hydrolase/transferase [Myxococcota bacterium]|nr:sulfatase-like hydrolase/transferase [Myxococcota bacterium]